MAIKKIKLGSATAVDINDARNVVIGNGINNAVSLTTAQYNALTTKDANTLYVITDASPSGAGTGEENVIEAITFNGTAVPVSSKTAAITGQDALVSGTNIKTINNESILGSGNITISGGSSTAVKVAYGVTDAGAPEEGDLDGCFQDCITAINAGKIPFLELSDGDGWVYDYYLERNEDNDVLTFVNDNGTSLIRLIIDSDDNVTMSYLSYEQTSNKVTSISSSSTDTQYPSAKCIYDNYLPLSGGTITEVLNLPTASQANDNTKGLNFKNGSTVVTHIGSSSAFGVYCSGSILLRPNGASSGSTGNGSLEVKSSGITAYQTITAEGFAKSGGTSSQFLKADGSTDSTTYQSTSSLVTSLSSSSTDAQYPSAKCVYDLIGDIETLLAAL